ncbi:KxYKxGKxW signal peptide domain-containing protein [Streptococcus sp. E17BB]|uniref:KxYKxGKxW signal peptide domain-containing protein n=1 Tax=Streptococcus sp. E17BB TaxID=3278714 RepID=UPI00359ED393
MAQETRTKGFRMWKSGKRWLFAIGASTAIFLGTGVQAVAQGPDELNQQTDQLPQHITATDTVSNLVIEPETNSSKHGEVLDAHLAEEDDEVDHIIGDDSQIPSEFLRSASPVTAVPSSVDVTTAKPVTIYYKPTQDEGDYYAYVWGDGLEQNQQGKEVQMTKEGEQYKLTVTPKKDATFFNYIIKKGQGWNNNKKTGDMTATVNPYTETAIYVGDDFYSQISNLQTEAFDKTFGYEDKRVSETAPDKFETVGSLGRLGATLHDDGTATINLWAPTAKEVKLNLYKKLEPGAQADKEIQMKRGEDVNPDDHTKNTVGVWHYKITKDILDSLNLTTAKNLAYDYTLSLPNAHFIQVEEQHVELNGQRKVLKVYRNSATEKVLNYHHKDASQTVLGQNREATREEVAAFYAGDEIIRENGNIKVSKHEHKIVTTQDPYSVAVIQGGTRSVILDPSKVGDKVTITKNKRAKTNSEVSVLEVNIRDFSIDESSGVKKEDRGNYLGFVQEGTKTPDGTMTGLDYLKYRGTNYLQMMPLNDFETVPELDKEDPENIKISEKEPDGVHNNQQNWGYDPKNYNVPEGSYATDPKDPENRIKELKQMMQKLHDVGLNVILDVVYNHLYHGQKNVFEQTVPGYFYAINQPANVMNNDIFVGNAVRSNSEMMRRYIVNSTAFWAAEYGMDGFRFDAMSDLDVKTLNDVRDALNKVGENIVTYGEGWDSMGKYLPEGQAGSDAHGKKIPTYGFFDATSRNAIVGHAHDSHLDAPGFVNQAVDDGERKRVNNPNIDKTTSLANSLLGGDRGKYANASQQLNYVECHDGMTLSDILKRYNVIDTRDPQRHLNRVELATAMSALAQGIHFSQHGQEFLRTKMNSVNTYNSGDEYNKIDWTLVTKHSDAVNFSKAITQLRLAEPLFQLSEYKDIDEKMVVTNAQDQSGVITYELRPDGKGETVNGKYLVIFNNNKGDGESSLTLGGDEWYYGGKQDMENHKNLEGNRGVINSTNDFSKAFIVTTNAKKLYDKIGQTVGEKKLTVDPLSATVLFIPAPAKAVELKDAERVITYVNRKGETVASEKRQAVTYLTVEETAPELKFGFEKSQIPVTTTDLGHKENIVNKVSRETPTVKRIYVATDASGRAIKANTELNQVQIGDDGKPVDTDQIKWKLMTPVAFVEQAPKGFKDQPVYTTDKQKWLSQAWDNVAEIHHPKVENHHVQSVSPTEAGDKEKVNIGSVQLGQATATVTVTYAKESVARIISENDPEEKLPLNEAAANSEYMVKGLEGDAIAFAVTDDALKREGYTYTVNGKANLTEALADPAGVFGEEEKVFRVVYEEKPIPALIIQDIATTTIPAMKIENTAKTTIPALIIQDIATTTIPALRIEDTATTTIPALRIEDTATTTIPALRIEDTATTTIPALKIEDVATTTIPALRIENTATTTIPALRIEDTAMTTVPALIIQDIATTTIPALRIEDTATTTIPALRIEDTATTTIPALMIEDTATTTIPALMIEDTATTTIPALRIENTATTTIPALRIENTATTTIPAMKIEDTAKTTIPAMKIEDTATTTIPAMKIEDTAMTTIPAMKIEDTATTTILALKIEDTATTTIPAMKIEDTATTTIPAMKIEDTAKTTIPAMRIEDTATTTIPAMKIEDTATTTIPALRIEDTATTTIPALRIEDTATTTIPALRIEDIDKDGQKPLAEPFERRLVDTRTGVTVILDRRESSDIVSLRVVPKILSPQETPESLVEQDYDLYDIDLVNREGKVVKMAYSVRVLLPVDPDKMVKQVLYLPETSPVRALDFTLVESGRFVEIIAKSFSQYAVIYHSQIVLNNQEDDEARSIQEPTEQIIVPALDRPTAITVADSTGVALTLPSTGDNDSAISQLIAGVTLITLGLVGVSRQKREE